MLSTSVFLSMHAMTQEECYRTVEQVKSYGQNSSLQKNWGQELLSKHSFVGAEKVIEVGCGAGRDAAYIAQLVPQGEVCAIDISKQMISDAVKNYPHEQYINLGFAHRSILEITVEEYYNVAFSNCCLHGLSPEDHRAALIKINQSLVPGGAFLFVGPGSNEQGVFLLAKKLSKSEKWASTFENFVCPRSYYTAQEYTELLTSVGFEVREITETAVQTPFENKTALRKWITSPSPYVQYLQNEQREQFLDDLVEQVLVYSPADDEGKIRLNSIKLEVIAIKKS